MPKIKPDQLSEHLARIGREFDGITRAKVNKGVRAAMINNFTRIVQETPVDTGAAQNSWLVSSGAPSKRVIHRLTPEPIDSKTKGFNIFAGRSWFLANNLPYIYKLEFGHSAQAPKGMVRINTAKWPQDLRKAFSIL